MNEKLRKRIAENTDFLSEECADCGTCCCRSCSEHNGYLYKEDNTIGIARGDNRLIETEPRLKKQEFEKYKEKYDWDEDLGFWSEDGCKIPRENRSLICNLYFCDHLQDKIKDEYGIDWDTILKGLEL